MSDEIKHECAVAMVVLRHAPESGGDFGGTKLSLLLEKQHNRGQDGAGAAILRSTPVPGEPAYWLAKSASATPLADLLGAIAKRPRNSERVFLGHLRYATFGKNEVAFCHPFVHESSELNHTLLLAGNFNLTNATELFKAYQAAGEFPTCRADGYLVTELVAHELSKGITEALASALSAADGAWTLCGATGDGWAFATRDKFGIRPGWYYVDDDVVAVASERPAIQAAFDVRPEDVKELPPGSALVVSPDGSIEMVALDPMSARQTRTSHCSFERLYFSRANDCDIHRERKALGATLVPSIMKAADAPLKRIFFSYIPNSARIAFHGLLERLFEERGPIRFGEAIVKDAKFRTFIADAAARREFYKHVYDVTYGLVGPEDTLVVLDDSIVRGNTMKNAILPMLDRLGPKRIVIASSAPPIRYPDCYGIDMSTLGELVAFKALVNLLGESAECELKRAPLDSLYARFPEERHSAEIARLLAPPGMKAEVKVVYQNVEDLHRCLGENVGDWYFTGRYPTPGGYRILGKAVENYLQRKTERSY